MNLPFAGYPDFPTCVQENKDKRDPKAYCGAIQAQVEGNKHKVARLLKQMSLYDRDWFFAEWDSIRKGAHADFIKQFEQPPVEVKIQVGDKLVIKPELDDSSGDSAGVPTPIFTEEDGHEGDHGATGAGVQLKSSKTASKSTASLREEVERVIGSGKKEEEDVRELPLTKPEEQGTKDPTVQPELQAIDTEIAATPPPLSTPIRGTGGMDEEGKGEYAPAGTGRDVDYPGKFEAKVPQSPIAGLTQAPVQPTQAPKTMLLHNDQSATIGEHIDALHGRLSSAGYGIDNRDVKQDGSGKIDYSSESGGHHISVSHDGGSKVTGVSEKFDKALAAIETADKALKGLGDILGGIGGTGGAFCIVCKTAVSSYQKCPRCNQPICRRDYNKHSRSHPPLLAKGFPFNLKFS